MDNSFVDPVGIDGSETSSSTSSANTQVNLSKLAQAFDTNLGDDKSKNS